MTSHSIPSTRLPTHVNPRLQIWAPLEPESRAPFSTTPTQPLHGMVSHAVFPGTGPQLSWPLCCYATHQPQHSRSDLPKGRSDRVHHSPAEKHLEWFIQPRPQLPRQPRNPQHQTLHSHPHTPRCSRSLCLCPWDALCWECPLWPCFARLTRTRLPAFSSNVSLLGTADLVSFLPRNSQTALCNSLTSDKILTIFFLNVLKSPFEKQGLS